MGNNVYTIGDVVHISGRVYVVFEGNFKLPSSNTEFVGVRCLLSFSEQVVNSEIIDRRTSFKITQGV